MEGHFKQRMRNAMKRLREEEELSRLPKITTSVTERRRVESYTSRNCQFSSHLGDTTTHDFGEENANRDVCFTKRHHQEEHLAIMQRHLLEHGRLVETLQEKIKCLQEELRKAKDLDFIKTAIISNLLSDREKLNRENKDFVRIYREKQRLSEQFEEELSRQQKIICDLLSDRDKLQVKNKELVQISLQLRGEKQQLYEYFDEKLIREKKLRKDCSRSLLCRDQLISLLNRKLKRCMVSVWHTKPEDKKESLEKMKPRLLENTLKKDWLKASIENLKVKKSKESRPKILGWLQESLKNLNEVSDKAPRDTLAEWLKASLINLQKEGPEASREDVNDWLDMSINQLQVEGPETSHLNVQEWLEASILGIQDLQKTEEKPRSSLRKGWLEKSIENFRKQSPEGPMENILQWLQESLERLPSSTEPRPVLEKWLQDSLKNLEGEKPEVDNQDVKEWLQTTVNNLEEEGPEAPHLGTQEWLEASIKSIQDLQKSKTDFRGSLRKDWLEKSIENLRKQHFEGPVDNILQWLQGSLERLSASTEPIPVLEEWLQNSLKNLERESSDVANQDVKEWLQTTINNLKREGPEAPHLGTLEWLEASIKGIRDLSEQYSKPRTASVEESRERVIQLEHIPSEKSLRHGWLQASLASSREHGSTASRTGVQGWLRASLERLRGESPDGARNNLEEWLQESMQNFQEGCPEKSRQPVKKWLRIALNHLQEGGPESSHLSAEEWLEASIQGLQEEIFKEMIGKKDSETWRRNVLLLKGIPSPGKQIVRLNVGKESSLCRKKQGLILKIIGLILLAVLLFAMFVHFMLYCVVSKQGSKRGLRPH